MMAIARSICLVAYSRSNNTKSAFRSTPYGPFDWIDGESTQENSTVVHIIITAFVTYLTSIVPPQCGRMVTLSCNLKRKPYSV